MDMKEMIYDALVARFTEMSKRVLGNNLTGVYLHGSAAMGCFNPKKSDLDFMLVVKHDIPDSVKLEFMNEVVRFNEEAPPKGLELSIVKKEYCNPVVYPTPFELHFSMTHLNWFKENPADYVEKMKGTDKDLAAHFMITRAYGKVLFGDEIAEIFGEVSRKDYIDSIWYDIENARQDILEDPMYMTLNLCRVLAYLRDGAVLSKKSGGQWGVKSLPEAYKGLIECALRCYDTDERMVAGNGYAAGGTDTDGNEEVDSGLAVQFADYMLREIAAHRTGRDMDR